MRIKIKISLWDIKDIDYINKEIVLYIIIYISISYNIIKGHSVPHFLIGTTGTGTALALVNS